MNMGFWIALWKFVFVATLSIFTCVALWVTVQGARDIKSMLADLRSGHEKKNAEAEE